MVNHSYEIADRLVLLVSKLNVSVEREHVKEVGSFVFTHFDELDLSRLHRNLHKDGIYDFFNAIMALLNKYHGFPKGKIPFELELQDYVRADNIMKRITL